MIPLASPKWSELEHAYGPATDIPPLLQQLEQLPADSGEAEPWFSLWSALAHQGDVYSASFAAVPHVIQALSRDPVTAHVSFFHFPAWVEICRRKSNVPVPHALSAAYFEALALIPSLIATAARREWDDGFLQCALAALAAVQGSPIVAEATLELSPTVATEFMEWFYER